MSKVSWKKVYFSGNSSPLDNSDYISMYTASNGGHIEVMYKTIRKPVGNGMEEMAADTSNVTGYIAYDALNQRIGIYKLLRDAKHAVETAKVDMRRYN